MAVTGDTDGLVQQVMDKLEAISSDLGETVHVLSGKRSDGSVDASAHNSGIAADVSIDSLSTAAVADALVDAGFSGVGEYYKADGTTSRNFAHGDIRGLQGSEHSGAYAPGGTKSAKACWTAVGSQYSKGRRSGGRCP